jgi:hypothetical protein
MERRRSRCVCISSCRRSLPRARQHRDRRPRRRAGGLIVDATVGNVARVRVTIISGGSFASVTFGLAPAIAAAIAAVAVLVLLERMKRRRLADSRPPAA